MTGSATLPSAFIAIEEDREDGKPFPSIYMEAVLAMVSA